MREEEKNEQQANIKEDKIMHDELMSCKYDFDEADRNLGISTFQFEQDIAAKTLEEVDPAPPTPPQNISTPKKCKHRGATHFTPKKKKESYYISERYVLSIYCNISSQSTEKLNLNDNSIFNTVKCIFLYFLKSKGKRRRKRKKETKRYGSRGRTETNREGE